MGVATRVIAALGEWGVGVLASRYHLVDEYSGWLNWLVAAAFAGIVCWLVGWPGCNVRGLPCV